MRDFWEWFLRNITFGSQSAGTKQRWMIWYGRVSTDSDSPTDGDEEVALPSDEKQQHAEEDIPSNVSQTAAPRKEQNSTRAWFLITSSIAGILLILVLSLTILEGGARPQSLATTQSAIPHRPGLNCGTSLASAKANNCTFDLLSYSWTPYLCYERQTDLEFRDWVQSPARQFGAFPFFIDKNGTARISDVEAMSFLAVSLAHTTQEEHLGHCVFWMRRLERILSGSGRFTERGMFEGGVPHSLHCTKSLLKVLGEGRNPADEGELHGVIGIGFNSC